MYGHLANLVVLAHGLICAFVLVSALAAISGRLRRRRRWEITFYVVLTAIIIADFLPGGCPLTVWENSLREMDRPGSGYRGSFIAHYLPFLPMEIYDRFVVALVAAAIGAFPLWHGMDRRQTPRQAQTGPTPGG